MLRPVFVSLCLLAALSNVADARSGMRGLVGKRSVIVTNAPPYLDSTFFGYHEGGIVDLTGIKPPSNTYDVIRLIAQWGGAGSLGSPYPTGCGGYNACGIDQWARFEKTQGQYEDALLVASAKALKARGIKRAVVAYYSPPLWALRGNRYEVANASIPAGSPVTIPAPSNNLMNGHQVAIVCGVGSALPTGLTCGTTYYVRNRTSSSFQLSSSSGGALINTSGTASTGSSIVLLRSIPGNLADLANYVKEIVQRLAANGIEVYAYEGLNEANSTQQPSIYEDAQASVELVAIQKTIFEAIKRFSPKTLVFSSPTNTMGRANSGSGCYGGMCWVESYASNRLLAYSDVLAFHGYPHGVDSQGFHADLVSIKNWMAKNGAGGKRIALTEYGLYGSNGTDSPGGNTKYVFQRLFVLAAHNILFQAPYAWDAFGYSQNITSGALFSGNGDGSRTVFNFTNPSDQAFFVSSVSSVFLDGVLQASGWTFTAPNTLTFSSAPGNGVAVTSSYTRTNYGWAMFTYPSGPRNVYGDALITVRARLLGFLALGYPVFTGDTAYVDFRNRNGRRLRAVWTISGAAGSHTVPEWGTRYFSMSGTETAAAPGSSITIDGMPRMIESL